MEVHQTLLSEQEQQLNIDASKNIACDSQCALVACCCRFFNVKHFQRRKLRLPNARCVTKIVLILFLCGLVSALGLCIYFDAFNDAIVPGWEPTSNRDIRYYIRPNQKTLFINPMGVCNASRPILLLIVVCSAANNFERRQTIRETWGNTTEFNYSEFQYMHKQFGGLYLNINYWEWSDKLHIDTYRTNELNETLSAVTGNATYPNFAVKILFLVGQTLINDTQTRITEESDNHNDIIQEQFLDTYNNLTLKTVMMLKWVNNNCMDKVKYLMKCDDDMFLNIPNLIHVLLGGTVPIYRASVRAYDSVTVNATDPANRLTMSNDLLIGARFCHSQPIRDKRSKWYVPKYLYGGDTYPNFLSGTAYLMSVDVAMKLYQVALATPVMHMEDVFLTGICSKAGNVTPRNHQLFNIGECEDRCQLRGLLTKHGFSAKELRTAYQFVLNANHSCAPPNAFIVPKPQLCH